MKKRKKTRKRKLPVIAVAWYKPGQWSRLRNISADRGELEPTYGEWQIEAEKLLKKLAAKGVLPHKVTVDTEELLLWCNERDLPVNGDSRSRYAGWLLKEMCEGKGAEERKHE